MFCELPTATPIGNPISVARLSPTNMRLRLETTCREKSSSKQKRRSACAARYGENPRLSGSDKKNSLERSCHISTALNMPKTVSEISLRNFAIFANMDLHFNDFNTRVRVLSANTVKYLQAAKQIRCAFNELEIEQLDGDPFWFQVL